MLSLTRNANTARIKAVQRSLCDAGFHCKSDGNFDSTTMKAVIDYQQANNLPQTGAVDDDLYEILTGAGTPPRAAAPAPNAELEPTPKKAARKPAKKTAPKE